MAARHESVIIQEPTKHGYNTQGKCEFLGISEDDPQVAGGILMCLGLTNARTQGIGVLYKQDHSISKAQQEVFLGLHWILFFIVIFDSMSLLYIRSVKEDAEWRQNGRKRQTQHQTKMIAGEQFQPGLDHEELQGV